MPSNPAVVTAFGSVTVMGQPPSQLNGPIVGLATTPDGGGYWLAARDGGVFAFGDARFLGSVASSPVGIVGIAATPDGGGYWLVDFAGTVHPFGDAVSYGSITFPTNGPIVGIAATPDGRGYWLVGADGGVFAFGDAPFLGSEASAQLNSPVVGIAGTSDGYWLVGADGGVFAFGAAGFFGSAASVPLSVPVVGLAPTHDGQGYWLAAGDGGVFSFGDAPYLGSDVSPPVAHPVAGIATPESASPGYILSTSGLGISPPSTQPQIVGDCANPEVEPASIVVTCADYGWILDGISWSSWGRTSATGVGTFDFETCTAACTSGGRGSVAGVSITLSRPVSTYDGVLFGDISWTYGQPGGSPVTHNVPEVQLPS